MIINKKLRIICAGILFLVFNFQFSVLLAKNNSCLEYKIVPSLEIKVPNYEISLSQPDKKMDLLHGDVVSTLIEEYEITFGAKIVKDGYCVYIKNVTLNIGYTNFSIQIDKRHDPDSCAFEAIKDHENDHIKAHLSVIDDSMTDIKQAIKDASNNILPIFITDSSKIDSAMNELEYNFQNQPQIILMRKKLNAEQEIRNKKVDLNANYLERCEI